MHTSRLIHVEEFLADFKVKLTIWGLILRSDRQKNTQTLADLELGVSDVKQILGSLHAVDYAQGPLLDRMFGGADMWVFGQQIKGREIYIKITMGRPGSGVICISFHFAEYPMSYPFKV
ncbi:MAG TPA: hypothetical protein PKD78_08135 [Saprospiraceae bacterium]|nr:hypothetical protein [Saprospiraceae bacterium]HNG89136.1 hypothetical protein [Saprospiraceae bacterium]